MRKMFNVVFFLFFIGFPAVLCAEGPKVVFDYQKRPFPDVPFPNDVFTRQDETSPTGMRIIVPELGATDMETRLRRQLLTLDGFSTYGPIVVSFDKPLDMQNIRMRHSLASRADNPFRDNAVFVINIDKNSKNYGRAVPLDLGDGNFPVGLEITEHFLNDTRANSSNLVFETEDEEALGRDTNFDGRILKPNLMPRDGDPYDNLLTFYDVNTNTLIIRVLFPLEERSRYAVILTKRLAGENGEPVASPYDTPYQKQQQEVMELLLSGGILKKYGVTKNDVAFAWSFSTQSVTADFVAIRSGLYGYGTFKKLAQDFPVDNTLTLDPMKENGKDMYLMEGNRLVNFLKVGASFLGLGPGAAGFMKKLTKGFEQIDYIVSGTFTTPYFLENHSDIGFYSEEVFHVNTRTGQYSAHPEQANFILCVPKATPQRKPPFPVALIGHGYTMNRLMTLPICGLMAEEGFAALGMDAAGHGVGEMKGEIEKFLKDKNTAAMVKNAGFGPLLKALMHGRDKDINGDGIPDSGADYWTAYVFHSRDMARQTIIDHMQIVRILRSFDGKRTWNFSGVEGMGNLAGDFNGDGVVDLGGPGQYFGAMGISLGGIHTAILPAVEPAVKVSVPIVGGGGLVDLGIRSLQGGVPQGVTLRLMGPLLVDAPDEKGNLWLTFQVTDINSDTKMKAAKIKDLKEGDWVTVTNEAKNVERYAVVDAKKRFRIGIPADVGDPLTVVIYSGDKSAGKIKQKITKYEVDAGYQMQTYKAGTALVSPVEGFGMMRNTPEYRDFMLVAQTVLDPADPINYAPHYFLDPLDIQPEGKVLHNVLLMPTVGDMNVPVNTGIALARAAGLLPVTWEEAVKKDYYYGYSKTEWNDAKNYEAWLRKKMTWKEMNDAYKAMGIPAPATPNQVLLHYYVIEGLEKLKRFSEKSVTGGDCQSDSECRFQGTCKNGLCAIPILADPDDLADGNTGFNNPRIHPPLRIIRKTKIGISALRIPYGHPSGSHFFNPFEPPEYMGVKGTFDLGQYTINQMTHYFVTGGKELYDDPCLAKGECR